MFQIQCTVRKCALPLELGENGLGCEAGHRFDRAKEGYWNLTQPQDKKSANPGDSREAVMARHRWLERGHAAGLVEALRDWVTSNSGIRILDLGCGDGSFGPKLFPGHASGYCGIDLSKPSMSSCGFP